jgi:hypothetical protein
MIRKGNKTLVVPMLLSRARSRGTASNPLGSWDTSSWDETPHRAVNERKGVHVEAFQEPPSHTSPVDPCRR